MKQENLKSYLKNPQKAELYFSEIRFDFKNLNPQEWTETLRDFGIDEPNFLRGDSLLENYFLYEDKKMYYNKNLKFLVILVKETFLVLSLEEDALKDTLKKISNSSLKNFVSCKDPEKITNNSAHFNLIYPFYLREFCDTKNKIITDFYDKLGISLDVFNLGLKENNKFQHYLSCIIICSLLEELFSYIANKENIVLNDDYNIANCIRKFKGEKWIITSRPENQTEAKKLNILAEENEGKVIITKEVERLLHEIKDIRKKYLHFKLQKPNNPSDNLILICCFGQFLIWCEENGYL